MTDHMDFYFDFSSPYGYFASTKIEALAAEFNRKVKWKPILLGPMFKAAGSAPLTEVPLKGDYSRHDFQRTADLFDIPYQQPDPFPIGTVHAARALLYMLQIDERLAVKFAHRTFRAYFVEQKNIGEAGIVLELAEQTGIDTAELAAGMVREDIKALLKAEVDAAMARGVFGSPFIFVDDEPFWGFDRFDYIRKWLRKTAKLSDQPS
ncbi:2-hydroxychromene-2-carboxylate isomerase [Candidimonas sp. SYP-B2681]|uniref:2-hydroxychromene-2-carboxylate isomerase n=1 Tax=Candidimonas sp. SYP-B2681 TaxID=2497686 RepID=UPI000F88CFEE|nr:2-hydroxychromene-2-carboxylate isomerase [Candidimonas sp. SYP-B2681]RTZ42562.1 2-hydroxychromene-2-carboxylate isomerase [Candidimonas sp. SYP-B2681]